jgi:hypothetical protein
LQYLYFNNHENQIIGQIWLKSFTLFPNRQFQLLVYACRGWWEVRYHVADLLKNFNKNCRNKQNISIFTSISYHSVFTRPPFLFFQHNQQYDTLLPIVPCTHKLKTGIAYSERFWIFNANPRLKFNLLFNMYFCTCVYFKNSWFRQDL